MIVLVRALIGCLFSHGYGVCLMIDGLYDSVIDFRMDCLLVDWLCGFSWFCWDSGVNILVCCWVGIRCFFVGD